MRPLILQTAAAAAAASTITSTLPGPTIPTCASFVSSASSLQFHGRKPPPRADTVHSLRAPTSISLDMSEPSSQSLQEQIIQGATMKLLEKGSTEPVSPAQKIERPRAKETNNTSGESYSYYVREGRRSEINEIADVLMQSFHPDSQPAFDSYIRRYKYNHLQMCFEAMDECDRGLFVACAVPDSPASNRDEQIVGFCSVDGRAPDPSCRIEFLTPSTLAGTSPRPYLSDLGVSTLHRRQGVGEKLVRACEEWTNRRGYEKLYLKVEKKNAGGFGLYSALGYKRTKLPWGNHVAESGWDTTVLMEKIVNDPLPRERRKRTWIKNQLWRPIKKSVDRYSTRMNSPPPL